MPQINDKTKIVAIVDNARIMAGTNAKGESKIFRTVPKGSHFVVYESEADGTLQADGFFHIGGQKYAHKDDFRIAEQGEEFLNITRKEG